MAVLVIPAGILVIVLFPMIPKGFDYKLID